VYWAAADLALYPSDDSVLTRAKSPLRLVELMGAGKPIVAHGVGEVLGYLNDGISGLIIRPGEDERFATEAANLARDAALQARLGQGARAAVGAKFTWDRLAERAEKAYDSVSR
jgi:glycosyltransferase involved in cell wall biosynthesis